MSPARPLRAARRLSDDDQRKLMTEQAALTALTKHPSWPTLVEVVGSKQARTEKVAMARVFSINSLSPAEAHYMRGFRDGLRYLVAVCEGAEDRLEAFLSRQTEGA